MPEAFANTCLSHIEYFADQVVVIARDDHTVRSNQVEALVFVGLDPRRERPGLSLNHRGVVPDSSVSDVDEVVSDEFNPLGGEIAIQDQRACMALGS